MADNQLDEGFEDVGLDEGFDEVPVEPKMSFKDVGVAGDEKYQHPDNLETLADFGAGATQGALLGGADELYGLGSAGAQKLTGSDKGFFDLYREGQKESEAAFKKREERSPTASLVGNIAGAVGSGIATGGLGLEAGIARSLGSVGVKEAAKLGGKKVATELGKQAAAAGTEAAIAGAIQGGLSSEATLEDGADKIKQDVLSGATLGAVAGGTLKPGMSIVQEGVSTGLTKAAGALKSPFKSNEVLREAFELGSSGAPVKEARGTLAESAKLRNKDAAGLYQKFKGAENKLRDEVQSAYAAADASGKKVPIMDDLEEAAQKLQVYAKNRPELGYENDREYKRVLDKLFMLKSANPTASQAANLADEVGELANKLNNPELRSVANRFGAQVNMAMKEVFPDIGKANDRFYNLKKFGTETFAQKGTVDSNVMGGFKRVEDQKALSGIKWALENINSGSSRSSVADSLSYAKEGLSELEARHPGTIKLLGIDKVDDLENLFYDAAKRTEVIKILNEPFNFGTLIPSLSPKGIVDTAFRGLTPLQQAAKVKTAHGLGKLGGKIESFAKKIEPKETAKRLLNMGDDGLSKAADAFEQDPITAKIGAALRSSIQNKGTVSKNAVIFQILNNKVYRDRFNRLSEGEEEPQE